MKVFEQLNAIVSKLDEANGRLLITTATTNVNIRESMEMIAEASIKLGELAERLELSE